MLAFVDELGDPGRKIPNGSSTHFVVALVTFNDNEDALACDRRIDLLRQDWLPARAGLELLRLR